MDTLSAPAGPAAAHPAPTTVPPDTGTSFSRAKMARGLVLFVACTVAGLAALYHFTAEGDLRSALASVSGSFMALAVLSAVGDLLIGAVRYHLFLRRIRPGTSLWLPIRADLANRFLGAVTPSQTGGGPAQVYVLWRGGIPVPDALSFLLINFLSTIVFFLVTGGLTAWIFRARFPEGGIHMLVQYGFVVFAASFAVMIIGLLRPEWLARPMASVARRLEGKRRTVARVTQRCAHALSDGVDHYRMACTRFVRENPALPLLSFLLTVVLYLNKFTLAWLVMRGLGVEGDYVTTLAVQALLSFVLFVAPSPGGSGIAEISTGALMAIVMPAHLLAPFTLVYRFFLMYLPATVGGVVLLKELGARTRRARPAVQPVVPGTGAAHVGALVVALLLGTTPARAQVAHTAVRPGAYAAITVEPTGLERVKGLVVRGITTEDRDVADALFAVAVEAGRAAVERAPDDPDAHYMLAVALGYALEHQAFRRKFAMAAEVRAEAERALELDPAHPGAHHVLGRLHAGAMRLNRVARLILREVLGASVLEGASWEQAEYHFREAWRGEPGSPRHAMELGALYMDTGRPALAREGLAAALRAVPRE
ncbi:MAG: flippase-like domain-containing protein, partial [Gemmatimonadetes bacterium]|nr:flippase-like domain-containing protein [Gemmatimonadota bacterium]